MLNNQTSEVYINDTKTTGGSAAKTVRQYMHSDQPKLYIASVLQTKHDWYKQFRGWRTDAIWGGRLLKSGRINTQVIRSEIVTFTDEEIEDALIGYASLVDDLAFKLKNVQEGDSIRANFIPSNDACLDYGRLCEYYHICHQIDKLDAPPANMEIDPWVTDGTVLKTFEGF